MTLPGRVVSTAGIVPASPPSGTLCIVAIVYEIIYHRGREEQDVNRG